MVTGEKIDHYWEEGHIQTTDGYDTVAVSVTPDPTLDGMMYIEAWVVAYEVGQTYSRIAKLATHGEIDFGAVGVGGVSVITIFENLSGLTWAANIETDGTSIQLVVNGNGDTVDWYGGISVHLIEADISGA